MKGRAGCKCKPPLPPSVKKAIQSVVLMAPLMPAKPPVCCTWIPALNMDWKPVEALGGSSSAAKQQPAVARAVLPGLGFPMQVTLRPPAFAHRNGLGDWSGHLTRKSRLCPGIQEMPFCLASPPLATPFSTLQRLPSSSRTPPEKAPWQSPGADAQSPRSPVPPQMLHLHLCHCATSTSHRAFPSQGSLPLPQPESIS